MNIPFAPDWIVLPAFRGGDEPQAKAAYESAMLDRGSKNFKAWDDLDEFIRQAWRREVRDISPIIGTLADMITTLRTLDLDVTEREELNKIVNYARENGAYLHIEVRRIKESDE